MKVLHINCNYTNSALHRAMFRKLEPYGEHRVFIPTDGSIPFTPQEHEFEAVCFRRYDRYIYFKKQAQIIRTAEQTYNIADFDCIHAYTLFTDGNAAMELGKKHGVPYVVAVRNTDINGFFKRRWLLHGRGIKVLENASAVFFLSEEYRRILLEKYIPRSKWEMIKSKSYIIPNGIDPFWLENPAQPKTEDELQRISNGHLKILFVGRVNRYKNPTRTGAAVDELVRRGYEVHFTAVGRVEEPQILDRLYQGKNFTYLEPRPKEELLELYRQSDIYVMPSTDETFGLVYPEAMSQGLPVIYSRGEGFYGQVPEGSAGYAVDPHSTEEVAEAILRVVREYRQLSARCPELAKRFDWDRIVEQYREIYRSFEKKAPLS